MASELSTTVYMSAAGVEHPVMHSIATDVPLEAVAMRPTTY